jgi:hypothetical protein
LESSIARSGDFPEFNVDTHVRLQGQGSSDWIQRPVSHFRSASWDISPESAIPCFSILKRDCEVELAHADEEVDATAADSKAPALL